MINRTKISCSNCGDSLNPTWARIKDRPPCPSCGKKGVTISVSIVEEINFAASLTIGMEPAYSKRDWQQRWNELKRECDRLNEPLIEAMSGASINAAHHRLQSFFIQAYHLKDALIADQSNGLAKNDVEIAISHSPILSLLADLANLDKHSKLDRTPRSGSIPVILSVKGQHPQAANGWQLCVNISHNGRVLDGVDIANQVLKEWRMQLKLWNLI